MGFAHVPNNEEASFCALIDGDGEVTDYIKLEHFMLKRVEGGSFSYKDREKLQKYVVILNENKSDHFFLFTYSQFYCIEKTTCNRIGHRYDCHKRCYG